MGLCTSQCEPKPMIDVYAQLDNNSNLEGTVKATRIARLDGPLPATLIAALVGGEYISPMTNSQPIQGAVTAPCQVVRRPKADRTKANLGMCRFCLGQFSTEDDLVKHLLSVCIRYNSSREGPILTVEECAAAEAPEGRSLDERW